MKLKRIYHPWHKWEEIAHNMWGEVSDHSSALSLAIEFTGDHEHYGEYMMRVTREWPLSCENALTDYHINRRAWIGHAAAALFGKIPEYITREAWRHLTHEQQLLANEEASRAIASWEWNQAKNRRLHPSVGETMLFQWDS